MIRYIISKNSSGEIIRTVTCDENQIESQVQAGETYIASESATNSTHYVSSGILTAYSPSQLISKNNKPNSWYFWNNSTYTWTDIRDIAQKKISKNNEINAARLAANETYFTYDGKQIAADPLSRSDIDGANGYISLVGELPPSWPGGWKAMDNTYVIISDIPTWILFYKAMVMRGTSNFNYSQGLKAELALAETPEEIDAIVWNQP